MTHQYEIWKKELQWISTPQIWRCSDYIALYCRKSSRVGLSWTKSFNSLPIQVINLSLCSGILTYYPTNLKFKWSLWRPLSSSIHKNTAIYYKIIKCVNKRLQMIDNTVVHQIHEHLYERYTIRSITPVSEEGWREKIHKRPVYLTCSMRNIFQPLLGTLCAK